MTEIYLFYLFEFLVKSLYSTLIYSKKTLNMIGNVFSVLLLQLVIFFLATYSLYGNERKFEAIYLENGMIESDQTITAIFS